MSVNFSLDTNLLIYAFDKQSPDFKRQRSRLLADCAAELRQTMSLQSLNEFCRACQKKRLLSDAEVQNLVSSFLDNFSVAPASANDLLSALQIHATHGFSHWDSLLLATCHRAGVSLFFSEDMQDGFVLQGMRIINPFRRTEQEIEELLASTSG